MSGTEMAGGLAGELGRVLRGAGLPCNPELLMEVDPYTVIDLSAAVERSDDEAIAYLLGWIDMLITEQMELEGVYAERPEVDFGRVIDSGSYQSLYRRDWTLYEDTEGVWRYVIRHEHAGDNVNERDVEWYVFKRTCGMRA